MSHRAVLDMQITLLATSGYRTAEWTQLRLVGLWQQSAQAENRMHHERDSRRVQRVQTKRIVHKDCRHQPRQNVRDGRHTRRLHRDHLRASLLRSRPTSRPTRARHPVPAATLTRLAATHAMSTRSEQLPNGQASESRFFRSSLAYNC